MTYKQKLREIHRQKKEEAERRRAALTGVDPTGTVAKHLDTMPPDVFCIETKGNIPLKASFGIAGTGIRFSIEYWLLSESPYIRIAMRSFNLDVEDFWENQQVAEAIYDAIIWSSASGTVTL